MNTNNAFANTVCDLANAKKALQQAQLNYDLACFDAKLLAFLSDIDANDAVVNLQTQTADLFISYKPESRTYGFRKHANDRENTVEFKPNYIGDPTVICNHLSQKYNAVITQGSILNVSIPLPAEV